VGLVVWEHNEIGSEWEFSEDFGPAILSRCRWGLGDDQNWLLG
jgi:hypothetical protein